MLRWPPEEAILEGNRRFTASRLGPPVQHRMANVMQTVSLDAPLQYPFRGIVYLLPPLSFLDGLQVAALVEQWDREVVGKTGPEARALAKQLFDQGTFMFWRHATPVGIPRWVYRHVMRNPFRHWTEGEFVLAMRFLSLCRTR